jgi:hypothetical protein
MYFFEIVIVSLMVVIHTDWHC